MKKILLFINFMIVSAHAQNINVPDPNLWNKLLNANPANGRAKNLAGEFVAIDTDNNDQISYEEAQQISYLNIGDNSFIQTLSGLENFINLEYFISVGNPFGPFAFSAFPLLKELTIVSNQALTYNTFNLQNLPMLEKLNVSNCPNIAILQLTGTPNIKEFRAAGSRAGGYGPNLIQMSNLEYLMCAGQNSNFFTALDVSNMPNLKYLDCSYNEIATIIFSESSALEHLNAEENQLTGLDTNSLTALEYLDISSNQISSLNLENCPQLTYVRAQNVGLEAIDLSNLNILTFLDVSNNANLTTIDLSDCESLENFFCSYTSLTTIYMKNGASEFIGSLEGCSSLAYICADETQIQEIIASLTNYGINGCEVNTYCTFFPGGTSYSITGSLTSDTESDGCGAENILIPFPIFHVEGENVSQTVIGSQTGEYFIPLTAGSYTITPINPNLTYFSLSPPLLDITVGGEPSTINQNFCLVPNGIYNDVEVTFIPVTVARPGFDSTYMISVTNKGNQISSGSVNLSYDGQRQDFVSAEPNATTVNLTNIQWSYDNLVPFERRNYMVVLNTNAPTETPAVNNGDSLGFITTISPSLIDETPVDNIFEINQIVVGSYDPNDKTCLEGESVAPTQIGEFVHYVIRFENTGTFPAENIVVKDMVDSQKFDVGTLMPIAASHPFITRITGNRVEFIFESINLPYSDDTNDGFISFKIKTLPTLSIGQSFSNTAQIYFDYNFPIITNTAITSIQILSIDEIGSDELLAYPNPAQTHLNIDSKSELPYEACIYDYSGRFLFKTLSTQIDVSSLPVGT